MQKPKRGRPCKARWEEPWEKARTEPPSYQQERSLWKLWKQAMRARCLVAWPSEQVRAEVAEGFGRAGFRFVWLTYPLVQVGPSRLELVALLPGHGRALAYQVAGRPDGAWIAGTSFSDAWVYQVTWRFYGRAGLVSHRSDVFEKEGEL